MIKTIPQSTLPLTMNYTFTFGQAQSHVRIQPEIPRIDDILSGMPGTLRAFWPATGTPSASPAA
ncbi:hypothetical protein AGMMS4952_24150 [Spirochaetia bacterium]|nr:hypothetical protein AGMMS4952_24150 [Spirochaetia bacterium]